MSLKPFLWAFRLVDERLRTFDLESFVLQDQAGTIDGRPCLILERKLTNADVEAVWVDPAREHCVARYSYTNGHSGVVTRQVDVSYQEAPEVGWIPSKWTLVAQANDGVLNMTTATVERYEINPVTQLSDFQPEFPRECLVVDGRGPHELFYLVAADGSRRDILPQELFAPLTYDDLANSKTGEALRKDGHMFLVYGVATALALGAAFLLLRRARKRLST